jgi:hypothetical protein
VTPPEGSQLHAKIFGQEIDLKGKAAKSAPLIIALASILFSIYAISRINTLDSKMDKVLFILLEKK